MDILEKALRLAQSGAEDVERLTGPVNGDSLRLTLDLMGRMMESLRLAKKAGPGKLPWGELEPKYAKLSAMVIQSIYQFCERGGRIVFIDPKEGD